MKKKISVVIPTYNEEGNVRPLAEAIVTVMETELPQYRYEILLNATITRTGHGWISGNRVRRNKI